jgi:hypothetical protein
MREQTDWEEEGGGRAKKDIQNTICYELIKR